jgi:hypothetical protein
VRKLALECEMPPARREWVSAISDVVPIKLAATGQTFYATIAMGATSADVTLAAGPPYGHFDAVDQACSWLQCMLST